MPRGCSCPGTELVEDHHIRSGFRQTDRPTVEKPNQHTVIKEKLSPWDIMFKTASIITNIGMLWSRIIKEELAHIE